MLSFHIKFVKTDGQTDNGKNNMPPIFRCRDIKIQSSRSKCLNLEIEKFFDVERKIYPLNYYITPSLEKEIELNPYTTLNSLDIKSFKSPALFFPISPKHIHIESFIPSSNQSCFRNVSYVYTPRNTIEFCICSYFP